MPQKNWEKSQNSSPLNHTEKAGNALNFLQVKIPTCDRNCIQRDGLAEM